HLAGRPQSAAIAAELIRTLGLAIQHAHAQQIVHRDLKPGNVLVAIGSEPWAATVKITDFGLAKRLDRDLTALTQDGAVLGTAGYMAPEQAGGNVRDISPATDVYALGAILYELLTGRRTVDADSWNRAIEQVLHEEPTPPSHWNAKVPRDLEAVCLKCLEK